MNTSKQTANRTKILLVDDNPVNLTLLSSILTNHGYQTRRMISGEMALKTLEETQFDLIILDIDMPRLNGYVLCQILKDNSETANTPIIFISALDDGVDKKKAFQVGGADYIGKPFQPEEIIARIENQVEILNLQKSLEKSKFDLEIQVEKRTRQLELTNQELKKVQQQLLDKSLKDSVTNVYNKVSFMGQLRKSARQVKSKPDFCFALLIFRYHCPQFANQILDSEVEDLIAISIADRLASTLKKTKMIARLAENEFAVILNQVSTIKRANEIAAKIQNKLTAPLYFQENKIEIEIYDGSSVATEDSAQSNQLLKTARSSAYQKETEHKKNSASSISVNGSLNCDQTRLLNNFEQAITKNQLTPLYKPIIAIETSQIKAVEVSLGWSGQNHKGIEPPELALILQQKPELNILLWQWLLQTTHNDLRKWQELIVWDAKLSTLNEDIKVYFKLSEEQLLFPNLLQHIAQISANLAIDSNSIILEIPESCILKYPDLAHKIIRQINKIGFSLSLDNLSTEYLVLNSQRNFPIEILKIDSCLAAEKSSQKRIIEKLSGLANEMNMMILVSEIEDPSILQSCQQLRLQFGMGSIISPPVPSQQISNLIQKNTCPQNAISQSQQTI